MGQDVLLGSFEELVLLAVARGRGDAYGMTVRREIEDRTGREVTIGAVYATLGRLEAKGLLVSRYGPIDVEGTSGRSRRHFALCAAGVDALGRVRAERAGLWDGLDLDALASDLGSPQ